MRKLTSDIAGTFALPLVTVLLLLAVGRYQSAKLLGFDWQPEEPRFEWVLFFTLFVLLSLFPRVAQRWLGGVLLSVHLFVVLFDSAYFRFFQDLPSFHLLPTWMQAGRVGDSVKNLLRSQDWLLLVPLFVYIVLVSIDKKYMGDKKRDIRLALGLLPLAVLAWPWVWGAVDPVRHEQLQRRFQNKAIASLFGSTFYHYYDFAEWARVSLGLEGGKEFDPALVKRVVSKSRELSTEETPFKGMYEGRDVLFLQLEALSYFAFDGEYEGRKVMPFLQQAKDRVFTYRLFDQTHLGRSADGQFIYLNSMQPPATRPLPFVYPGNKYFGLPWLFREKGYSTYYFEPVESSFWNAGTITVAYGFQHRFFRDDLPPRDRKKDIKGWGLTDSALLSRVWEAVQKSKEPYFGYVVTVMCHHPYSSSSTPSVDFPPKKKSSMVRRYLRCAAARDASLKAFMMELATTERGRKTVICLAGDHDGNLDQDELREMGYPPYPAHECVIAMVGSVEQYLGLEQNPLRAKQPRDFGGQMDMAPTIGHVFSLNMEESVFVGWNLLATQNRGPHYCRVGTMMDQTGKIQLEGDVQNPHETETFEASEMLLQWDKIRDFSSSL